MQKTAFQQQLIIWIQALRIYSFTATTSPILIAVSIAYQKQYSFTLINVLLILLGVISLHAGTNLVNDYYDFKHGIDTPETLGSSRVLTDRLLTSSQMKTGICICYGLAVLCGLYFLRTLSLPLIILLVVGLVGSFLYTGGPFPAKYHALGEGLVFLLMGPLLSIGIFLALTGTYSWTNTLVSFPLGLLITAILTANNFRDIEDDRTKGIQTLGTILGPEKTIRFFIGEIILSYICILLLVILHLLPALCLLSFFSLALFLPIFRSINNTNQAPPLLVENTAKNQFAFGLLLAVSFIISHFLP